MPRLCSGQPDLSTGVSVDDAPVSEPTGEGIPHPLRTCAPSDTEATPPPARPRGKRARGCTTGPAVRGPHQGMRSGGGRLGVRTQVCPPQKRMVGPVALGGGASPPRCEVGKVHGLINTERTRECTGGSHTRVHTHVCIYKTTPTHTMSANTCTRSSSGLAGGDVALSRERVVLRKQGRGAPGPLPRRREPPA